MGHMPGIRDSRNAYRSWSVSVKGGGLSRKNKIFKKMVLKTDNQLGDLGITG